MICIACGNQKNFRSLWKDTDGYLWAECPDCLCHLSTSISDLLEGNTVYPEDYVCKLLEDEGGPDQAFNNHLHNLQLFNMVGTQGTRMLDVGTGHGVSQRVFMAAGWETHGFDVNPRGRPAGTVIADEFCASFFPRPFDLVLCREVLEHVPKPKELLCELAKATTPETGLCQITTPRPQASGHSVQCYNRYHVCLFSPLWFEWELGNWFLIEAKVMWPLGQRYVLRV